MNKIFLFFLIFIFLNNCSYNSKSKFWTKEKNITNIKNTKLEIKDPKKKFLFKSDDTIQNELNPNLKIKITKSKIDYNKTNHNNNSIDKYSGNLKKISKFKFSKIEYFDQYEPEIIFEKESIIFFDNKGAIKKYKKNKKKI